MCEILVLTTFLNYAESITNSLVSYLNYDVSLLNSSVLFFWKILVKVLLVFLLALVVIWRLVPVRWLRKMCLMERSLRQYFAGLELTVYHKCPQDLWMSCLSFPSDSRVSSCLPLSCICKQFILLTSKLKLLLHLHVCVHVWECVYTHAHNYRYQLINIMLEMLARRLGDCVHRIILLFYYTKIFFESNLDWGKEWCGIVYCSTSVHSVSVEPYDCWCYWL